MSGELLVQSIVLGVLTGGVYALAASGLTLIFGIMRVINVAHAAMIVMAAYLSWWLFTTFHLDPLLSIVVVMPVFFVLGALVQWGILRRLVGRDLTLTVLVTFGFAIILEGLQGTLFSSSFQAIKTSYSFNSFEIFGYYVPLIRLLSGVSHWRSSARSTWCSVGPTSAARSARRPRTPAAPRWSG